MKAHDPAVEAARRAIAAGMAGEALEQTRCRLLRPLAVEHPSGGIHSWLVPVVARGRLLALVQIGSDYELLRVTSFQRHPGSVQDVPSAPAWLSLDRVRALAASIARSDETLGEPTLTYDQVPDRVGWRVEATAPNGSQRVIFVAGEVAYEPVDLSGSIGSRSDNP